MSSNFTKGPNCTFLDHSPNLIHSNKISFKNAFNFSRPIRIGSAKQLLSEPSSRDISSVATPIHEFAYFRKTSLNKAFSGQDDQSHIIRKKYYFNSPRDLRLIVHGSKGGKVHPLLKYVVQEVRNIRGTSVELEVLSDENLQMTNSSSIWLVPLLLLPGKHLRNDVPRIFARLKSQGVKTNLLPFIGSWPQFLSKIQHLIAIESKISRPALVHHPLSDSFGLAYLDYLEKTFRIPIISWQSWKEGDLCLKMNYSPIPYYLAPNHHTKLLNRFDLISSLLEIKYFMFELVNMLVDLP